MCTTVTPTFRRLKRGGWWVWGSLSCITGPCFPYLFPSCKMENNTPDFVTSLFTVMWWPSQYLLLDSLPNPLMWTLITRPGAGPVLPDFSPLLFFFCSHYMLHMLSLLVYLIYSWINEFNSAQMKECFLPRFCYLLHIILASVPVLFVSIEKTFTTILPKRILISIPPTSLLILSLSHCLYLKESLF